HDDEQRIERAVRAVVEQDCPEPVEVVVVTSGTDRTAAVVRHRFPEVRVVELPGRALPGAARNAGLALARGEFVSFPGSHVELPPGSLAARLRAHREGHAMVTGTLLNGTRTASGWASYFLDHSSVLPGRPSGPLTGPPDHCSYMRHHLLQVGGFRTDMRAGEDTLANRELARLGYRAYRAADVRLYHRSPCRNPLRLAAHHFTRGRALGRILVEDRARLRSLGLRYPRRRLATTQRNVRRFGADLAPVYARVMPLVVLGVCSAWAGAWYQVLASLSARAPRGRARTAPPSPSPVPPPRSATAPRPEAEASRSSSPRTSA
ncbi:MAG: glycosyltransferase family 2 protein, partial [Thermoleophilaceae bacterium]